MCILGELKICNGSGAAYFKRATSVPVLKSNAARKSTGNAEGLTISNVIASISGDFLGAIITGRPNFTGFFKIRSNGC